MNGGATATTTASPAVKSVLYKPVHDLTEDDICQLTREDCRRFLKEKGMRRPSWNKSQAIQQVISLKSLLDPSPAFAAVKTANCAVTVNPNTSCSVKDRSPAEIESETELGEDRCPNQHEGPEALDFLRKGECRADDIQHDTDRCNNPPDLQVDQITIFYSGKVNVSDRIPIDKACSIMHLAASPIQFCQDEPNDEYVPNANAPCQQPNSNVKLNLATPVAPSFQSMLADVEGQTNRQVSLQRYLEKRKDRGKFKMKRKIGTSSCPDMHHLKSPVISRQSSESNTSTTIQRGAPHTGFETKQNHLKNFGLSVDLNDKG